MDDVFPSIIPNPSANVEDIRSNCKNVFVNSFEIIKTTMKTELTVTVGQHQSDRSVEFIGSAHQTENTASAGGDNVRAANVMQSKIQQAMDAKKSHLSEIQQRRMELPSGGAGDARPNHVQKKTGK